MSIKHFKKALPWAVVLLILSAFVMVGCQSQTATETATEHDAEHSADHEHSSETESSARVPNDGAVIRLVSPTDGVSFASGEDVVVEVEVENFDLTAEGNHWHLYVDGSVLSMISDGTTKSVIHALEPGEHLIEAYLGLPTHEELEEGASATITVSE